LVTVLDTIAPVAPLAPANITVACATDIPAPVDLTATDACDGAITSSPSGMMIPGTCSNQFTMIRTWTFTDNSSNSSSVSQTIIVNDSIAPVAAAPADITVACVSDIPAPTTLTALDNCGDSFTVSPTGMILPYTGCSNQMTMVRTWTFTDSCGNSASVSQNIIVNDSIAPTPPAAPVGKDFECASDIPNPMMLTAVDNCGDSITVMPTDSTITGSCPHDFTLIRTWTFTDSCGNSSSVSQTFNVNDTIDPVVALHDTSLVIGASGSVSIASSLLDAGTTDNCTTGSLLPPFTITPATLTFTCANVGENKVGITFTDECGNSASDTATITILSDMMASVNPNPANTCEGTPVQLNGNPSGGSGTYTHTWTGDVVQLDATNIENPTFAATSSGAFNLTYSATDANGCSVSDSVVVSVNALPLVVCTQDSVDCFGGSTGSATVAVSGGSAPYSYSWSPGGATAETATNLSAGTYTAVVTDALGCSASCTVTVLEPNQMLAFAAIEDSITCFGADDGVLAATAFGGNGNYVYMWVLNGTDTIAVGDTVNNMPTGTYTVYVSDGNGCSTITGVFLPGPPQIIVTETHVNVLCFGESTGSIDLTVSGGTAPYTYIWSNNATSEDISSLVAGPYTVTVTDNRGCTVEMQIIISENPPIVAGTSQSNVLCHGSNDGTATVFVSGGVGPYMYSWNSTPVQTTQTAFSLMAGNYQVTITDAVGCTKVKSFDILEPALLDASASVTNVSCNGANDGTATITQIIGGIPPYLVIWNPLSNPDTANSISGLAPGTYTAQVSDSNWCVTNVVVTITQPQQLFCQMITSPITCPGGNDGKLTAVISGGTAPYTYVWSNGATDAVNTGLTAGTYTVTVTDDNGCSTVCSGTIIEPQALSYNIFVQDVNCAGANDGKIIVNVAGGGTPPYSYTWNTVPTQTTSVASNLGPGMYTLIITDAAGCITTITETVNENPAIVVSETLTNVTCNGGNDGEINLAISGGVMPYTILWSNGNTTMNNSGLSAGTYAVTITDSVGCVYTNSYVINEPGPIVLSAVITNASCNASSTGSITLTPSGGNGG
ncbi:MAG: hypothetical protein HKO56_09190, partial [Bacteroidia bacterium]|nr:hypothetical protein [Bacteroidia bacterium]